MAFENQAGLYIIKSRNKSRYKMADRIINPPPPPIEDMWNFQWPPAKVNQK